MDLVLGLLVYIGVSSKQEIKKMITEENTRGSTVLFKTATAGVVREIQYTGPFLTLVVFEKFLILKDVKVMFQDMESITQSFLKGVSISFKNKQELRVHDTQFLQCIPKEFGR